MRRTHFEALKPVCPVCRAHFAAAAPLALARVEREQDGQVVEGLLQCARAECLREYPIIDGIPMIVADLRGYVGAQVAAITERDDLGDLVESVLADCCGPGSPLVAAREQLSIYAWDHYADLDPDEAPAAARPGSVRTLLRAALAVAEVPAAGVWLDLGCSVGRTAFDLAAGGERLVLGVDLHHAMLRVAARVLRLGEVRYPRRRVGVVFDQRRYPVALAGAEQVDFWACDATALPFAAGTFDAAVALNLLDCVNAPRDLLASLARVLKPGGQALLSTPYDWSNAATPFETWLGGHSQRGPQRGASEPVLRALLTAGAHPASVEGLSLVAEAEAPPWRLRTHERAAVEYRAHLVVARRDRDAP